jgi:ATP-binding cassette subfamily F protein 3
MLQLSGAGKRFGPRLLFENADWLITPTERTALVGANGAGKSTLMKVLGGLDGLDYGSVQRMKGMTMGYLPQDGLALSGRTVFEECLTVFDELRAMEQEFEQLAHALAELDPASKEYEAAADRYSHVEGRLRHHDVYALDAQVGTVLTGLGIREGGLDAADGGVFRRLADADRAGEAAAGKARLAAAGRADEPPRSGDEELARELSEHVAERIHSDLARPVFSGCDGQQDHRNLEQGLHFYHGNYEKYLTQKAERRAQLEAAYKNQRERIEHLEAFINRFRYQATKAKQVQSRIKELEKIERIEIPLEEPTRTFRFRSRRLRAGRWLRLRDSRCSMGGSAFLRM